MGSMGSCSSGVNETELESSIIYPPKLHDFNESLMISKIINKGMNKYIEKLREKEKKDTVKSVKKLRVPLFDNLPLRILSYVTYITGNAPFHEGLIFESERGRIYVAQTYPVTFKRVRDMEDAFNEIISFCQFNQFSKEYQISNIYKPGKIITLLDIADLMKRLPNEYNILGENCQRFCDRIIDYLNLEEVI